MKLLNISSILPTGIPLGITCVNFVYASTHLNSAHNKTNFNPPNDFDI